jgi:N-acetylmuramoyl-L-alanine amidase
MRPLLSTLVAAALSAALAAPAAAQTVRRIVIDPGHGGSDPGGVGSGLQEKNIVLDVGRRFKTLLDADTANTGGGGRWVALLTRSTDVFVSLSGRASFANAQDADRFMSIHSNAFSTASANGTETFSFAEGTTGAALRNLVQAEMIAAWGLRNRGNKVANFAVLRETAMPAVLHELGFITNATDAAKLRSATERQKAAVAHLRAIQRHFGITPFVPASSTNDASGELTGSVADDLGPVEGARVALDTGVEVVTPADGSFVFVAVPAGTRTITVTADGHEPATVDLEVAVDAPLATDIQLVRIVDPGPQPGDDDGSGGDDGGGDTEGDTGGEEPGADDGSVEGGSEGCALGSSGSGSGLGCLMVLLAVAAALRRRRRG